MYCDPLWSRDGHDYRVLEHRWSPGTREATKQLDSVFASRGLHENIHREALNGVEEWGSSDHYRLLIKVRS